uniref:pyridoxal-phosphate dependent enzyme n=1 Tax=uncultured Traorella sp. TaxID=1929048 RepID=UPI0025E2D4EC
KGAIAKAMHLHDDISNSLNPQQFETSDNPLAHYEPTANEHLDDTDAQIDIFVAGIGTGGTISGVGRYLKEHKKDVEIIGVEPLESAVITTGEAGKHKIQGIGAGFIPKNLDQSVVDKVDTVSGEEAYSGANELAQKYGILCGISSGAAYFEAKKLQEKEENKGKNIVVLLPDTGERYLSTDLFK